MTTQTYRTQNTWNFARTLLAILAVLAGITMFIGVVVFMGGLGDHNTSWVLTGLGLIVSPIVIFKLVRRAIEKLTGKPVTPRSPAIH